MESKIIGGKRGRQGALLKCEFSSAEANVLGNSSMYFDEICSGAEAEAEAEAAVEGGMISYGDSGAVAIMPLTNADNWLTSVSDRLVKYQGKLNAHFDVYHRRMDEERKDFLAREIGQTVSLVFDLDSLASRLDDLV